MNMPAGRVQAMAGLLVLGAIFSFTQLRADVTDTITIETELGSIQVGLDGTACPLNVAAFKKYISASVYEGSFFHTMTSDGDIMGGKPGPQAKGFSGSGNMIWTSTPPGEFTLKPPKGALEMGRTVGDCNPQKHTNSTQFGINRDDRPKDQGEFTTIGYVTKGMDVVEKIAAALKGGGGKEEKKVLIKQVRVELAH